jgi:methylenetetrahydrofolate dehydrogenase (NADP+) / methenyltetrahydrofolate cyclohydrolase
VSAELIDGTSVARRVRENVTKGVAELVAGGSAAPGLATVLIGNDPASQVYVRNKRRACTAAGMRDLHRHLPGDVDEAQAAALIDELAADPTVSGILLQLPTPAHLGPESLLARIPADKDVDGLTTANAGLLAQGQPGLRPCTPSGVIALLDAYDVTLCGANAVVVGRSVLVGKPMAQLLLERDATVTTCHSRTRDLADVCRDADILVVAAGIPGLIGAEAIKPGATVIDVGIHRAEAGLCGDVDSTQVAELAGKLTPVPGGVGPMTIAMLLANTLTAAQRLKAKKARREPREADDRCTAAGQHD